MSLPLISILLSVLGVLIAGGLRFAFAPPTRWWTLCT